MSSLYDLPRTEEESVLFFQEKGILPSARICKNGHEMKLNISKGVWRCTISSCDVMISIRSNNWFSGSRIPFLTAVRFIYHWTEEVTSIKWCRKHLNICDKTTIDWNSFLREVCFLHLLKQPNRRIGGPGKIVEIDETLFTRRKSNAGWVLPQQWIFGGICRKTGDCFLVPVPNREATTLMTKIVEHIEQESTIYSDCWRAYKTDELERAGYSHFTVNHKYNFVDPTTGAHTQNIERLWGSAKWRNKKQRGTARHHLESYLAEFMWKKSLGQGNAFENILKAIAEIWQPQTICQ
ncbi:uncharacterized protein LOC111641917 [Centruroides sculpturatus]|uniref:uncharacterized protein LOC111641917 n=1 Tax=Centruroides sculpturatus TaxID=218467 RepID=UPI000C6E3243|nr:uncharacterized protein LOC111641917 [Centruroides sculpturatus]